MLESLHTSMISAQGVRQIKVTYGLVDRVKISSVTKTNAIATTPKNNIIANHIYSKISNGRMLLITFHLTPIPAIPGFGTILPLVTLPIAMSS